MVVSTATVEEDGCVTGAAVVVGVCTSVASVVGTCALVVGVEAGGGGGGGGDDEVAGVERLNATVLPG